MIGNANEAVATSCEQVFDQFISAVTCKSILSSFNQLLDVAELRHVDHRHFYETLKTKLKKSWKAQSLWTKLDKRASHRDYKNQQACANMKVLVIGSGPCGLRTAIECAFLGAKTVIVEKRDRFSRNNVLHLWPYLITDLRNLGAKKFFGKFCAGAIDHISIRQLQCILLKVALLLGVEVHVNVSFEHLIEPPIDHSTGWHCKVSPENHPVLEYEFNALIAADGKRNTLPGFRRKEFRGKLAIAVTANFINRNTQAEARVEEISGVAFIFNQKFFLDLKEKTRIDLENIVYYKDDTHYFVMTAKKASLLEKGVLKEDYTDTVALLDRSNVNQEALMAFAREAADFSTNYQLPCLEYAVNHYGQADVAMFDFTSMFAAENASRFIYKNGYHLLMGLVGDTLLEPFWPTGSGCARGFLGAFDAAWMIRSWALGRTPLQVLSERESIFTVLSQTTPNYLHKNHNAYSLDPNTRYPNLNLKAVKPNQVKHLYDGGVFSEKDLEDEEIVLLPHVNKVQNDATIDSYTLLRWCQKVLNTGKYRDVHIVDFTSSWRSGLALCALIHSFRPELIQNTLLMECEVVANNKLAFSVAEKELGIAPVMAGEDMAKYEVPDKLTMIAYLSQFYELFKNEPLPSTIPLPSKPKRTSLAKEVAQPKPSNSPKKHSSLLQKLKLQSKKRKDQEENEEITFGSKKRKDKKEIVEVELTQYNKLPMEEIANRLQLNRKTEDARLKISKNEERSGAVSVTAMADLLVSKFKSIEGKPPQELIRKMKGQPTLLAATPESEFCSFCHKRVYIMERMSAEGEFFHRQCFKCDHCGVSLRLTNYSCDRDIKPVKFYCYRHALPELRVKTLRQRSLDGKNIDQLQQIFTPSSIDMDIVNVYSENTDSSQLTSQMLAKDVTESKNMPERVEFEISFDGCEEESEEEQFEHNLRASLSNPLSDDNEESDSDSYSDFDSDDELWESALESLKSPLLSSELQRSWHAYQEDSLLNNDSHSLEYLSFRTEHDKENEESSTEVEQDSDDEGSESKKQEDTYDSSKEEVSQTTLLSPVSRISQSKANFFSEPPTVVSLDPWSMFGMGSRESQPKEEIKEEKLSSDHVLSTKNLEVEQLSSADSLDDLNMDVYMDNLPEEGATENKGDTDPYESSKNWELYSENDGDDEHGTDNGIGKSLVSEDIVSNEDSQFIEGRLSPSARKAKKYRMKRQSKHLKKTLHNVMSDSEVDKNVSDVNNFSCNDIEESHGVTNYADITLDMVSVVSDSSDIDDLIIANIDDRFVTSRMKKIKMSSHSRSKKKIHKKTKKNDSSNFPPQVEQNVDSKVKLDIFSDITKPSILAFTESFSDSSDASANDKVLESNSKSNHSVRVEPIKSEGQGISSIPSSPVDNQNESFCSENFFTPAQHFEESPFIIATDKNKNVCLDPVMLHKSDSNSSIQKTGSDLSNSHSQTSLQNTESLSSNQNTESYLKSSSETTEPKNSLPDLSALRITNVDTPIRTKVPVDKSRLLLGSSSDLAESDLEPESKRKISADGIFIDKTRALDIPFADESETDENFATPQVFDKTSFPPANPSICEQNLPLKVSAKVYVQDNFYVNKNPADLSKDNKESRISSLTLPLGAEVNTETADSNLGVENKKPEHNDSYTYISPNSSENVSVLSSKVAVKNENKVSKKETKNELAICSVFHSEASKRKENIQSNLRRPISVASKVKCDDLSDELSDESHVSFKPMQKKADDLDARVARRLSRMHAKQQKRAEQRRLRMAQEIQRQLEEVEVRQRELEERGIAVEKLLRGDVSDDDDVDDAQLMSEWFSLVHEKNALLRYESELNVRAKELELEDRQARLESDYRERSKKSEKTESDIAAEGELLNELVEVVEQRNNLVAMLEEDRLREQIEDYDLKKIMAQKGYLLSPLSCDVRREKEILHI